jgi:CheY-like chemotaxis protein
MPAATTSSAPQTARQTTRSAWTHRHPRGGGRILTAQRYFVSGALNSFPASPKRGRRHTEIDDGREAISCRWHLDEGGSPDRRQQRPRAQAVCVYVEAAGYRVIAADSPADAVHKAHGCARVHVAVVDLEMPGGEGFTLIQTLRRIYPSLRALYLSGYADARLSGCFIGKPFSSDELLKGLRLLLEHEHRPTAFDV